MKIALLVILTTMGAANLNAATSGLKSNCRPIRGFVSVEFTSENCTSPVGLCTKGKLWGDPLFQGETSYVVEKVAGSSEDPTTKNSLTYSGTMKINTRLGEVTVTDLGLMDNNNKLISSQSRTLSGIGKMKGLSGAFFTIGKANEKGFASEVHGIACFERTALLP